MLRFASTGMLFNSIQTTKTAEQKGFLGSVNDARGRYFYMQMYIHIWVRGTKM